MTSRWLVEEVAPHRNLDIHYRSISLKVKNDSDDEAVLFTHNLLRMTESVRATEGDGPLKDLYWEMCRRIHHEKDRSFSPEDVLEAVGVDLSHAAAFSDPGWDEAVEAETAAGIDLVGQDIGTPILALTYPDRTQAAIFGPVMTPIPRGQAALDLWDGMAKVMSVPGFYELKRTRNIGPDTGPYPA
ncbi:MAG: disulfide bond formation protein DsbA [Acidimicrobiales bacterium]